MKKMIFLLLLCLAVFPVISNASIEDLKSLPIQDGGRVKPFDTFAREYMELLYGKEKYDGKDAYQMVMTWVLEPTSWADKPLVEIRHGALKEALRLSADRKYFSINEVTGSDRLSLVIQDLAAQRETKEKLDPYFQAVQRLENQIISFREIAAGRMIKLIPPKEGTAWLGLDSFSESQQQKFIEMAKLFVVALTDSSEENQRSFAKSVLSFEESARAENPALYPSVSHIKVEIHYNSFHPFKWAWITFVLAAFFILGFWVFGRAWSFNVSWIFVGIGVLLTIYGFILRTYLSGRAPVTNMYETVVWVGFGTIVFAIIIELVYRWKFILFSGSVVAAFCLALADMAPAVLDSSLQPLEPVLRSNFWLTTHVLTITISYAAFFLAFMLADIGLVLTVISESKHKERIKAIVLSIYRCIQIGVGLLGPGIILGGIWADYSWGRFWGWDPKETWALIALLGYLAILHGRLAGYIKDFGMLAGGVISFSLVIMAWYGVNYVLGAGLHSYGFGAGGVEYVAGFVGVHLLFVTFATFYRRRINS